MNSIRSGPAWRRLALVGLLLTGITGAQITVPEVLPIYVLTATRTPSALTTIGSYVDTLSATELARMQRTSLSSALSGIAGAPIFASGAGGGVTSLFLRGANSNQTLFLVDGIRFNDPNTDYAVALGGMSMGAGDSLEVVHGPQSTLYGGEAVGGVLALRAMRGAGIATRRVSFEAGAFGTAQAAVQAQGGDQKSAYNFSARSGRTQNSRPNNDFNSTTYVLRLDRQLNRQLAVGATVRGFLSHYGSPGDRYTNDPDNEDRENQQLATVFVEYAPTSMLISKAVLGGQDRRFVARERGPSSLTETLVKNRRLVLDWQNTLQAGEAHRLTAGLTAESNHTRNTGFGNINQRQQLMALFVQDEWTPAEHFYLTAGVRSDDHDAFGRATTGRATLAWLAPEARWKLRATYGTAFRAPSFLDLFGRSSFYVGNPRLRPEEARGWDAGADYFLPHNRGILSATWFDTQFTNLINYDFAVFPGTVRNVGRARTRGGEISGKFAQPGVAEVRLGYTYLEADDLGQGTRLLRRPRHSGAIDLWHDFGHGFTAGTGLTWQAQREDVDAATYATIHAEDYTVARIYAAWQAAPRLTLKVRLENIFNEKYEEVNGYPQLGFGLFGGVELKF
jgi:vitamin B12 transporter